MLESKALRKLDLSGTKLTIKGAEAVARALRVNTSLTWLSVQDLNDDGLRMIGAALHANPSNKLCSVACDAYDIAPPGLPSASASASAASHGAARLDVVASGFGTGSALLLANVLKVSTSLAALSIEHDAFSVPPLSELRGDEEAAARSLRLTLREMPPAVAVQYGLLLGSLLSANEQITSATLLNDFGAGGGADFPLPLAQLVGEGSVMFVDLKGGGYPKEIRSVVSGLVVGALLRVHQTLNRLDLRCVPLSVDGGKAIAEALRWNTSITSLSLPEGQLGDEGVEHIAAALEANEAAAVSYVNLSDNGVAVRGAQALAQALRPASTLTSLDGIGMSGTYFRQLRGVDPIHSLELKGLGDVDSPIIGRLLESNTTLTALDLGASSNNMGKLWGRAVADALLTNTTLTALNLGSNGLGDAGGAAVAEALHGRNFKIRSLTVSSNRLGKAAGRGLAGVLANEANLTMLDAGSNDFGDAIARTIFESVARNHSLTSLNLSATRMCEMGFDGTDAEEGIKASADKGRPASKDPVAGRAGAPRAGATRHHGARPRASPRWRRRRRQRRRRPPPQQRCAHRKRAPSTRSPSCSARTRLSARSM
jgi:Ran GTPase-activating protein (RanGAP) involved in mRNA processing and transport